jgi:hypothetical protein
MRESEYALTEAIADYSLPSQLRFLFANLLVDLDDGAVDSIPAKPLCRLLAPSQPQRRD